jgi:methylated-DNA-[protein]-cysteine S-methyltransferase
MDLSVTYYASPLGRMRISGNDQFISEVHFMDEGEEATGQSDQPGPLLIQCVEEIIQYFQGQRRQFDFPVSQQGTSFQQKVWGELTGIAFGKTLSYLDLARRLGDPKVIRAAASANGKNKLAIVVPCHRVIGSNQQLVGYAAGIWRKKWLLQHEAKLANGVQTLF